jgi:DNA polymerase-3 subunit alpha
MLRRAMGKKKPEEMAKQREIFTKGALERGVEEKTATYIFDLMEKFAGYGFNKSHSAAYALVSYQTAWLKAHYPAPFMAAVLSADMDNTDKVVTLIDECRHMQLEVVAPDVNRSGYAFTVEGSNTVIYGLGAVKGVGEAAIDVVIHERLANGVYQSLFDLCRRVDSRKVTRRVYEALIRAGALDKLGPNRASLMAQLPEALQCAEQQLRDSAAGQSDMFGSVIEATVQQPVAEVNVPEWDEQQRLAGEKETLGLYLTGHPIDRYREELDSMITAPLAELTDDAAGASRNRNQERTVVLAGLVVEFRTRNTQSGSRIAFVTLDDRTARMEIRVFSRVFEQYRALLANDKVLVVQGTLAFDDFSGSMRLNAEKIYEIDQAREVYAKRLVVDVTALKAGNGFVSSLANVLSPYCEGTTPVGIHYLGSAAQAHMTLGDQWRVHPTDELLHRLRELAGDSQVRIVY